MSRTRWGSDLQTIILQISSSFYFICAEPDFSVLDNLKPKQIKTEPKKKKTVLGFSPFLGERQKVNSTFVVFSPFFPFWCYLPKAGWHGGFVVCVWQKGERTSDIYRDISLCVCANEVTSFIFGTVFPFICQDPIWTTKKQEYLLHSPTICWMSFQNLGCNVVNVGNLVVLFCSPFPPAMFGSSPEFGL